MSYGKFPNFEAFLDSYVISRKRARDAIDSALSFGRQKRKKQRAPKDRDVVEVNATIAEVQPDDTQKPSHQHLKITITAIVQNDPDIEADVEQRLADGTAVFVSVRYGDRMGLTDRIPGLSVGDALHLKGEWIPQDKAYAHGGEKMSVLHFTHDPLGFICTESECYS